MTTNLFVRIGTYEKYNEAMLFFSERGYKWASGADLQVVNEYQKVNIDQSLTLKLKDLFIF